MMVLAQPGTVEVVTTDNGGASVEVIAERALTKIIHVGQDSHPLVREQAEAFKNDVRRVLVHYMHEAVKADRSTMAGKFRAAGFPQISTFISGV